MAVNAVVAQSGGPTAVINNSVRGLVDKLNAAGEVAFYAMMGWDWETGVPTAERLAELGISWAGDRFSHLASAQ